MAVSSPRKSFHARAAGPDIQPPSQTQAVLFRLTDFTMLSSRGSTFKKCLHFSRGKVYGEMECGIANIRTISIFALPSLSLLSDFACSGLF